MSFSSTELLETMMETESLIQKDLRQKGHQLYLESAAQVSHLNFERVSSFFRVKYLSGRVFWAARARGMVPLLPSVVCLWHPADTLGKL